MIDRLKFFPFAARIDNKPQEVRGPYFPSPQLNKWLLGDNVFYFKAPRSNPILSFSGGKKAVGKLIPGKKNILETLSNEVYFGSSNKPTSEWRYHNFYKNNWFFVGPWFTGMQAVLKANAYLIIADKEYSFGGKNLFHPRIFEAAISNQLDESYGYEKNGRLPQYRGPMNWKTMLISPEIRAAVCDLHCIGNSSKENPTLSRFVFFPIAPEAFIKIIFNFGGTEIYRDNVRAKPQLELCDSIIDSMKLEVGPNTQGKWDQVKNTCPDMSITESMGEFPWPLKFEKQSKKSVEIDITPGKHQNSIESK